MKPVIPMFKSALLALTTLFAAPLVVAKDNGEWKVNGDLIGKKDKVAEDLSGIACTTDSGFPRTCLLIDDEQQSAQVVTLSDGEITAGRLIPLIDDRFDGNPVELDGEGVAFADNFFYVIGSHGRPRHDKDATDQAKEAARVAAGLAASSKLIRLKFNPATGEIAHEPAVPPSSALARLIAAEALFAPSEGKTLEDGGVTVEGVAVGGQRLFAGFRGPVIENKRAEEKAQQSHKMESIGRLAGRGIAAARPRDLDDGPRRQETPAPRGVADVRDGALRLGRRGGDEQE